MARAPLLLLLAVAAAAASHAAAKDLVVSMVTWNIGSSWFTDSRAEALVSEMGKDAQGGALQPHLLVFALQEYYTPKLKRKSHVPSSFCLRAARAVWPKAEVVATNKVGKAALSSLIKAVGSVVMGDTKLIVIETNVDESVVMEDLTMAKIVNARGKEADNKGSTSVTVTVQSGKDQRRVTFISSHQSFKLTPAQRALSMARSFFHCATEDGSPMTDVIVYGADANSRQDPLPDDFAAASAVASLDKAASDELTRMMETDFYPQFISLGASGWQVTDEEPSEESVAAIPAWGDRSVFTSRSLLQSVGLREAAPVAFGPTYKRAKVSKCSKLDKVPQGAATAPSATNQAIDVPADEPTCKFFCVPHNGQNGLSAKQLCELGQCLYIESDKHGFGPKHMPAHTDRILVTDAGVVTQQYRSFSVANSPSDHAPVLGTFTIPLVAVEDEDGDGDEDGGDLSSSSESGLVSQD